MKQTSTVLFLLAVSLLTMAQNPIPKKANTIIITDTLTLQAYYNHITDVLFESGYGILTSDPERGTISTTEKSYKNGIIKLNILIKDGKVSLRGDFKMPLSMSAYGITTSADWSMIEYAGAKNSPLQNAFSEMNKIAMLIPGTKEYEIR